MRHITRRTVQFLKREDGRTAIERAVMLALILIAFLTALMILQAAVKLLTSSP
jgi:Flp pilus assembly pilin Flp